MLAGFPILLKSTLSISPWGIRTHVHAGQTQCILKLSIIGRADVCIFLVGLADAVVSQAAVAVFSPAQCSHTVGRE